MKRSGARKHRPSVAVAHPLMLAGGSEMTAMWTLHALQDDYDLTLLTGGAVEWKRLNVTYGTAVEPERVRVIEAPMPRKLKSGNTGDALRGAFFQRFTRRLGSEFDLCISSYNIMDFGSPGVQLIGDFSWDEDLLAQYDNPQPGLRGIMRKRSPLRSAYLGLARAIGGGRSSMRYPGNVVVANSRWTALQLRERHGLDSQVIYPPVSGPIGPTVSGSRSNDFVLIGRISPEKRIEEAIDIIGQVRKRGHSVRLHVLGPMDESRYCRAVRERAAEAGPWVVLHGGVYGAAKMDVMRKHAFGIHMRKREAFGIAVAEQVKMGLIPFVPAEGGPVEIVDDTRLTFGTPADATKKICTVLENIPLRYALLCQLNNRASHFSTDRFVTELRLLVQNYLATQGQGDKSN